MLLWSPSLRAPSRMPQPLTGRYSPVSRILVGRALRAFADGYVSLLLPFYLTACGYTPLEIGALVTATLLGSGVLTLATGFVAHRYHGRTMLLAAAWLMIATGIAFSAFTAFWPLVVVAFVGTMNPSSGDSLTKPSSRRRLSHTGRPTATSRATTSKMRSRSTRTLGFFSMMASSDRACRRLAS